MTFDLGLPEGSFAPVVIVNEFGPTLGMPHVYDEPDRDLYFDCGCRGVWFWTRRIS